MTSEEISALAKTHAEAILGSKLTKAELVMLMACVQARIQQAIFGTTTIPASASVKADVVAPPAPKPLGAVIAQKGYPCVCIMCAQHVYTVNKDVHENTTVKEFIESYTPMPGFAPISRQTKISNIENNITTNCPSCGGELSLYLAGKQTNG